DAALPGDYGNISSSMGSGACIVTKTGIPSSIDKSNIACGGGGYIEITYSVTDNCGNQYPPVVCRQDVEVAPVPAQPVCPDLPALTCEEADAAQPGDYGNIMSTTGTGICIITKTGIPTSIDKTGVDICGGVIIIRYSVSDNCGNQYPDVVCEQQVLPAPAPVWDLMPGDIYLACNEDPVVSSLSWTQGAGSGTCGATGQVTSKLKGLINIGVCAEGYQTEEWTYTPECGDPITHSRKVFYKFDKVKPYIYNVPKSIVIPCGSDLPPWPSNVTTGDNCPGDVSLMRRQIRGFAACGSIYWERSWIATDECGNVTIKKQNIHFSDTKAPSLTIGPDMVLECGDPIPEPDYEASDDCSTFKVTFDEDRTDYNDCEYKIVRTWTVRDACGNSVTKSQTIEVVDNTAPVITPVNPMLVDVPNGGYIEMYNCESPQVLMEDVVIDECCKIASSEAKDELITTGKCDMFGFYRRFKCSVTAVDAAGNEAEYFFYVHLIDTTAPEILNAPADLDLPCEADVPVASQDVGVKDDCMLTKTPQFEENTVYDDSDSSKYAVVRIWHSTDNCGNRGEAVQIVTVCDFDKSLLNSTIGNTVWFDANQNGLQEAEEGGINGVKVILYRVQQHYSGASATKVDSTVSATVDGIAGKYSFEVTRGSYLLQFVAPEGMSFTTKGAGVDETNSDADPATGMTDVFSIGYAEENLKLDAGLYGDPVLPDFGELETQVNVINASDITAFPNPVSERVNVSLPVTEPGEVDIKLLDQLGQEVVGQREYMSKGTHTRTLDVSQAPAGMYLLHVSMPNGVVSKMLIKQ
ncbi:MAG: T9SS type A sorting domain-containing protein, partial [Saprospiraceae bacterium]|nr:T9SS type A sorting domain-containing protein [Saprospiraceae bacterium]